MRFHKWVWVAVFAAFLGACGQSSQSSAPASTDTVTHPAPQSAEPAPDVSLSGDPFQTALDDIRTRLGVPGMAVGVVENGTLVGEWVSGVRQRGAQTPVERGDVWHLGSNGKSMAVLLTARAVDAGLLDWETPLGEALRDGFADLDPEYARVTVRQLLNHTSGLPANPDLMTARRLSLANADNLPEARRLLIAPILAEPPQSPPGERYTYSNTGYIVLAAVLDQKLGKPFETALVEDLMLPAGISADAVMFGPPSATSDSGSTAPFGHRGASPVSLFVMDPANAISDNPPVFNSAGRVSLRLQDWARLTGVLMGAEGFTIVSDKTRALFSQAGLEGYSLGLVVRDDGSLWHNGSNGAWYATQTLWPEDGLAILIVGNAFFTGVPEGFEDLTAQIRGAHQAYANE